MRATRRTFAASLPSLARGLESASRNRPPRKSRAPCFGERRLAIERNRLPSDGSLVRVVDGKRCVAVAVARLPGGPRVHQIERTLLEADDLGEARHRRIPAPLVGERLVRMAEETDRRWVTVEGQGVEVAFGSLPARMRVRSFGSG